MRHKGRRRALPIAAILIGFGLLTTAGVILWQSAHAPPVYQYVMGKPVAPEELGPLAVLAEMNIPVHNATLVSAVGTTLVDLAVADSQSGPVLVQWHPRVDEPFLRTLPPAAEVADLVPVLERHMPSDGILLAWWDSSREFELLAGLNVAFGEHLGIPLFVPTRWQGSRARIESIESNFWQTPTDKAVYARFQRFVQALLEDEQQGMAELHKLAGHNPAVLALHVRDIILLGQLAPDKIGVAFRDFPFSGNVHGMVGTAHRWLNQNGYDAYAAIRLNDKLLRIVALTDEASGDTLAARLLPFIGNDQSAVDGATLVYKTGGFWVYELASDSTRVAKRKE